MADATVAAIDATASLQNLTKISRPRHPGMTGRVGFEQIRLRVYQPYILWHKARTALPLPDSGRFHLQNADWGVAQSPQVRGVPAPTYPIGRLLFTVRDGGARLAKPADGSDSAADRRPTSKR